MSTKKTAPSIPAKSGLVQQNCTSRKGKGRDYSALFQGKTRMRIALETGCRAEYLTTDQHTCFEYFLRVTEGIWARLQDQRKIDEAQTAIWNYLFEDDFGSGGFYFKEIEQLWPEIQAVIDKEARR